MSTRRRPVKIDGLYLYFGEINDYEAGSNHHYLIKATSKRDANKQLRDQELGGIARIPKNLSLYIRPLFLLNKITPL